MNCERAKELFSDALVLTLHDTVESEVEAHLISCASCRAETADLQSIWEKLADLPQEWPSAALDIRVHTSIEGYRDGMKRAECEMARERCIRRGWLGSFWPKLASQFAIAVLLFALGVLLGSEIAPLQRDDNKTKNQAIIVQLREQIADMKHLLTLSLLQGSSASERLRGVQRISHFDQPDEQILSALLRVLELDPNPNVRLAAADTLQEFGQAPGVRKGLLDALAHAHSPLLQIDLIRAMVRANEKDSVAVLKGLLQSADVDPSVRESAQWALQKLG